jgi:hypothetical protein
MTAVVLRWLKVFAITLAVLVGIFGLMQLVPYGRTHSNPPVFQEPPWNSPHTRELAKRACFDCHSNETRWPWYANVAPFSWVVEQDVDNARSVIDFSAWNVQYARAPYCGQTVIDGMMPPAKYVVAHPEAKLTRAEQLELASGLDATIKASGQM